MIQSNLQRINNLQCISGIDLCVIQMEIDTEVTQLLIDNAAEDADLVWSKTLPIGVKANCLHTFQYGFASADVKLPCELLGTLERDNQQPSPQINK